MSQQETWRVLISSGLRGDLVVLFRKNPGIVDTIDGVARRLGVMPETIQGDVTELLGVGFLKTKHFGDKDVIYLDEEKDRQIQESATQYLTMKQKMVGTQK